MEPFSSEPTDNTLDAHLGAAPDELMWMRDGKCRGIDPAEFFPSDGLGVDRARRVCDDCPVRAECLEYALANDERFGIWGGMSERERRKQRRRAV